MLTIGLEKIKIHAPIGYYPEEKIIGNDFLIDIYIKMVEKDETITDLSDTIDYSGIYKIIKAEMEKNHPLIETTAQHCLQTIKEKWPKIAGAEITIRKLHPPMQGE